MGSYEIDEVDVRALRIVIERDEIVLSSSAEAPQPAQATKSSNERRFGFLHA